MHTAIYKRYHDLWSRTFASPLPVSFDGEVVRNAYCPRCRYCCGPQAEGDAPFPMALLDWHVSPRTPEDFYLLDGRTACLDQRGCRALTPTGGRLDNSLRPVACNLFPYVLVDRRLWLYLICPASMLTPRDSLRAMGREVHAWLDGLPAADVERISIGVAPAALAARYLDLEMPPVRGLSSRSGAAAWRAGKRA